MAKSVWTKAADLDAFKDGKEAAEQGRKRVPLQRYLSYNERAAFNDGWDSVLKFRVRSPLDQRSGPSR